eukprot:GHRQ01020886.1.p1 GENE.GHRQ01020886.1~~GHRQ01020886.1.p1  ORF type:complete len:455 (+),score=131.29 GHRQ01020886.1:102-1466(+)
MVGACSWAGTSASELMLQRLVARLPRSAPRNYPCRNCKSSRSAMAPAANGAPQSGLTVLPSEYPEVLRDPSVVEELHGSKVADPYRWLEDPDSPETQAFVEAQNKLTAKVLEQCTTRDQFKSLFTALYDYPKYGTPFKRGDRYYYYYNSGLQQQYVLYGQDSLQAEPVILLDPNTLSGDGTVALKDAVFSDNGQLVAYQLSSGGSDWSTIKVLSVGADGAAVPHDDLLQHVKFSSIAWTHDHKGFFYNRFAEPKSSPDSLGTETDTNQNQLLCYHVLGTPQSQDATVLADPGHPLWMFGAEVTDDGRYLLVYASEGCQPQNRLFYLDLQQVPKAVGSGALDFSSFDFFKGGARQLSLVTCQLLHGQSSKLQQLCVIAGVGSTEFLLAQAHSAEGSRAHDFRSCEHSQDKHGMGAVALWCLLDVLAACHNRTFSVLSWDGGLHGQPPASHAHQRP